MDRRNVEPALLTAGTTTRLRKRLLRKYALLFAGIVSLALLASGFLHAYFSYQEQKSLLVRVQREQANAAAAKISQFIKEIEGQMAWTTHLARPTSSIEQQRIEALRLLRQSPAIAQISLLDANGREQLSVSRLSVDVIGSQLDRSHQPGFAEALAGKTYYGPIHFRLESEPYMTIGLSGAQRVAGVTLAEVNLKFIWDIVSEIKVGERGQAYVVDGQGRLIAHPNISLVLSNLDLSQSDQVRAARAGLQSTESAFPDSDLQGERVLTAHAVVPPLGWRVFIALPISEAFAPIYSSLLRAGALLLAALALAIFAGIAFARRMIAPINALRSGAERIGRGDLAQRISIKTGDELEAVGDQFNAMASQLQDSYATLEGKVVERTYQLEQANLAKSRFLAVASHDLRQPLHALGLFVAQLREQSDRADRERIVDRVEDSVTALNELFDGLLDMSKLDAGVLAPKPVAVSVVKVFDRLRSAFSAAAAAKGIRLRIVDTTAWAGSDPILLERILLNLVSNAVRYTQVGSVLVGCRRRDGALRIEVLDTGWGIPAERLRTIFAEFVRLNPSPSEQGGLGLGLSIVQRLCELLGHQIEVQSTLSKGSRFVVTLPEAEPQISTRIVTVPADPSVSTLAGVRVVVVDDDPLVLEAMAGLLRKWGCRVSTHASAGDVLEIARKKETPPNLIICDYALQDYSSGFDLIMRLRDRWSGDVLAFVISGDTTPERLREARDRGFHLLHKPVSPMALRAIMLKLLHARRASADA
jgi:signal transduction histidine kinase